MQSRKNVSDALVIGLEKAGIRDAFVVTGGAIAGFTEALNKSKIIRMHFMLTEQSAAIAAESYGHFDGNPALLVVTSGPGVTNALTGVAAAWTNSTPLVIISGQARSLDVLANNKFANRQWGNQHLNSVKMVSSITKFVAEPTQAFDAEAAALLLVNISKTDRNGPTWLSLPSDIQRANLDLKNKIANLIEDSQIEKLSFSEIKSELLMNLLAAKRPVIFLGNGARVTQEVTKELERTASLFGIALITTWTGMDLVSDNADTYFGRPGTIASSRVSNFVIQECDLLIILGARLDLAQIGFRPEDFAIQAQVLRFDIDPLEFLRIPTRASWQNYTADAGEILESLVVCLQDEIPDSRLTWINYLKNLRNLPTGRHYSDITDGVSTYKVISMLDEQKLCQVMLGSSGTCVEMVLQAWRISSGQRFLNSGGLGSMGFALAGGIGISLKTNRQTLVIESDGSFAMNIQDLETISRNNLNLKIVILDSSGYKSIKLSQKRQGQTEHGTSKENGVFLPNAANWARAAGIESLMVDREDMLENGIAWLMDSRSPRLLQVMVSESEEAVPRLISKLNSEGRMETAHFTDLWPEINDAV